MTAESHTDTGLRLRQYPAGLSHAWAIVRKAEREDDNKLSSTPRSTHSDGGHTDDNK